MKRYFSLIAILFVAFFNDYAVAQMSGTSIFFPGHFLEVGQAKDGSFGSGPAPTGYSPYSGWTNIASVYNLWHSTWSPGTVTKFIGDYTYPGTPFEGWCMQTNGVRSDAFYTTGSGTGTSFTGSLTGSNVSYSVVPGSGPCFAGQTQLLGLWQGTCGGLNVSTTTRVDTNASWVVMTTTFKNNTGAAIPGVYFWRTFDPDDDETYSYNFNTNNVITAQNDVDHRVLAGSYGTVYHQAYSALATKDCRAKSMIYSSWSPYPAAVAGNDLNLVYAGTATDLGATYYTLGTVTENQDIAIGLIYNLGTIAAGDSTIISYAMLYRDSLDIDSAFPEPLLYVNCVPIAPSGAAPAPTYDTINPCSLPPGSVLTVNIGNATDKNWSWSHWNWAPATGLGTTTGVNNTITLSVLSSEITYTITGTAAADVPNCAQRTMYITILPPCFNATNNGPICYGDTLKLTAHGDSTGATYVWSGPGVGGPTLGTGQYLTIYPATYADSGDIYVIKTETGGIKDTVFTHVVIKPLPVVTATSNSPICSGSTLDLFANPDSAGETFSWTGPDGFTSALQNPTIAPSVVSESGIYKVYTTLNGCNDSGLVDAVIDSTPTVPTIGSNSPVCSGDTLLLTSGDATSGVGYSWSGPAGFTSTIENPYITGVTVAASGTYTVVVSLGMCSDSATTLVVINQTPFIPGLSSNSPVCSGSALYLYATSTAGSTYSWTGVNGFSSSLQNPTINPATTLATGTYSVIATLDNCPSAMATIAVVVDSTPAAPVASSNSPGAPSICEGDTLLLFASDSTSGVGYSWAGPNAFTSTSQNPEIIGVTMAANGQYTVTVSNGTACTNIAIITVSITAIPAVSVSSNSPVCTGNNDTLFLYATAPPGATYSWTGPFYFSSGNPDPQRDSVVSEYAGIYPLTVYLNGCSNTAYDTVVVNQTPLPAWVVWLSYCRYYGAPPLQADGLNILWYPTDTANGIGSAIAPIPPTGSDTVMWFYVTQTVDGCISALDSMKVTVNPKPVVWLGGDTAICPLASVTLSAIDTVDASVSYHWSPYMYLSDTTGAVVIAKPETNMQYTVIVSNQYGCTDTASVSINVYPAAVITLPVDSITLYPGQTYQISPTSNCYSFMWFPPAGLSDAYISNPLANPLVSTKYIVDGTTEWGCITSDSIIINVDPESLIAVPNAFTPGNGPDNVFKILLEGEATLSYFRIWDRWGEKVFETTDINQGWDGTFNGTSQPLGVYVYQIEAITSAGTKFIKNGNVTLLR